jgi:hypothetical protein
MAVLRFFGRGEDADGYDPYRLSSPQVFLLSMLVFLAIVAFIAAILTRQITSAFSNNPGLYGLILGVLVIGILLAFLQVIRLFREVRWVNSFRAGSEDTEPVLLAPMKGLLSRSSSMALSTNSMRTLLDSIATRLDESRDISRYLIGLLVFLGLLGTFWGLIETVSSVGNVIQGLKPGGDSSSMFDTLREGLAAPLSGMGISFSSSLFGLAGSLVLGFLDLQSSQAQNRFYTELEDWLSTTVYDHGIEPSDNAAGVSFEVRGAVEKLRDAVEQTGSGKAASAAMANLAEAIQGLVHHMRNEQQMIRDWVDAQAEQQREIKRLLEVMVRERVDR